MSFAAVAVWKRSLLAAAGLLGALTVTAGVAEASGRVFLGLNVGVPAYGYGYGPPAYYPAPAYYPPPAYYYPPPAYYGPPPVAAAPGQLPPVALPPVASAAPAAPGAGQENCREFQSTTVIGGQTQAVVGTACLQADGTWRIVR